LRSLERRCPRDLNGVLAHERERNGRTSGGEVGWMVACWIDKALHKIFFTPSSDAQAMRIISTPKKCGNKTFSWVHLHPPSRAFTPPAPSLARPPSLPRASNRAQIRQPGCGPPPPPRPRRRRNRPSRVPPPPRLHGAISTGLLPRPAAA
jgi:hypothetical protein